jgi:hypothetical protein
MSMQPALSTDATAASTVKVNRYDARARRMSIASRVRCHGIGRIRPDE